MPDIGKIFGSVVLHDKFSKTFGKFGQGLAKTKIGFGTLAIGAAAAGAVIAKSVLAYDKQILSVNQLNLALANQGNLLPGTSKRLQEYASGIQKVTTFGDEAVLAGMAQLASFGLQEEKLKKVTSATLDMAAATGMDLKNAMLIMGRASVMGGSVLTRYGISVDMSLSKTEQFDAAVEQLSTRFGGAAALQAETFAGKLKQISNATGDVFERIGFFVEFMTSNFAGGIDSSIAALEGLGDFFGKTLPTVVSEAQAQLAEFLAFAFDLAAKMQGPAFQAARIVLGLPKIGVPAETLKVMAEGQRELATEIRDSADAFLENALHGKDFKNTMSGLPPPIDEAGKALQELEARLQAFGAAAQAHKDKMAGLREVAGGIAATAIEESAAKRAAELTEQRAKSTERIRDAQVASLPPLSQFANEVTDVVEDHEALVKSQEEFNAGIQAANQLAQLLGGTFGSIIGQISGIGSTLKSLSTAGGGGLGGIMGGLTGAFKKGSAEAGGGIMGLIGGAANIAGPIAALAGPVIAGISQLFKMDGPNLSRDIARDMGPGISEGLEQAIKDSGKPVQLAIADIFAEGFASGDVAATADRFAEEIGDIFSGLSRGEFAEPEAIAALEESIPMLIDRFGELGSAGEEQVQRIINAAQEMGIEFEGLGDLISASMGPSLQDVSSQFDLSIAQTKELAETLGVSLPTATQKLAAELGIAPKALKEIGSAVEEQFGIPMEQIQALMDTMGVSIEGLAASMKVDLPDALGTGTTETQQLAADTERVGTGLAGAVDQANRLAEALGRAAGNSRGINIPSVGGGEIPGLQHGGVFNRPTVGVIAEGGPEVVAPVKAIFGSLGAQIAKQVLGAGGGGGTPSMIMNVTLAVTQPLGSPEALRDVIIPPMQEIVDKDLGSMVGRISRKLERS